MKNKNIKLKAALLAASVLVTTIGMTVGAMASAASAAQSDVKSNMQPSVVIKYRGAELTQLGRLIDGKTMIPVTALRDDLGMTLSYNATTKTYTLGSDSMKLNLEVSSYGVSSNLNDYFLYSDMGEYEVQNLNGRLYVPFKLLNDFMGYQGNWNPSLKTLDMSIRLQNAIDVNSQTISKVSKDAEITVHYPQLSGLSNDENQQTINNALKQNAERFVQESEEQAKRRDGAIERAYYFGANYAVTYNQDGIISIVSDQDSYTGGAHGGTLRQGMTFSLKDGKLMDLGDLLKKSPDYKQTLNRILKQKTQKDEYKCFIKLSETPDFYVKEGGLVVFFQQYEIAPYAGGIPTYTIPFGDILPKGTDPFAIAK